MIPKCARPRPLAGTRPLSESNAGAHDAAIVGPRPTVATVLPAELLELADRIAEAIVRMQRGGQP